MAKKPIPAKSRPLKQTTPEISAIAGRYLSMEARGILDIAKRGAQPGATEAEWEALVRMTDDIFKMAGSCLSQDETSA